MKMACTLIPLLCGCAPYAQVQIDLLRHVEQGLAHARQSLDQKSQIIHSYHTLRRAQLDDAFDADVRARESFHAEWIIEHRKAYAAAIDAIHRARDGSERAAESDQRNLAAMRHAIERLIWLQSIQSKLLAPFSETNR